MAPTASSLKVMAKLMELESLSATCTHRRVKDIYFEQFKVFGKVDQQRKHFLDKLIASNYPGEEELLKKPGQPYVWFAKRFISIGYYALVDIKKVVPKLNQFDASIDWYPIYELPEMIMHRRLHEIDIEQVGNRSLINEFGSIISIVTSVQRLSTSIHEQDLARLNLNTLRNIQNELRRYHDRLQVWQNQLLTRAENFSLAKQDILGRVDIQYQI